MDNSSYVLEIEKDVVITLSNQDTESRIIQTVFTSLKNGSQVIEFD